MKHDPERDARDYAKSVEEDAREIAIRFPEEKTMHTSRQGEPLSPHRPVIGTEEGQLVCYACGTLWEDCPQRLRLLNAQLLEALETAVSHAHRAHEREGPQLIALESCNKFVCVRARAAIQAAKETA